MKVQFIVLPERSKCISCSFHCNLPNINPLLLPFQELPLHIFQVWQTVDEGVETWPQCLANPVAVVPTM